MNIRYYTETDTLHIEFRDAAVSETRDLDEDTLIDIDDEGNICAITVEHASTARGNSPVLVRAGCRLTHDSRILQLSELQR